MENKVCSKCNIAKTIDNFRIKKNGYIFTVCKDCEYKENMERYYRKKMSNPKYVENKKIEIENTKLQKQGLKKCMVCKQIKQLTEFYFRKDRNTYRSWCIDCEKNRTKNFYKINKDEILDKQHQHYKDNRIILLERKKKYAQEHKEELREYHTKYIYNRRKNDDIFHFKSQIRHLINQSFRRRGIQKKGKTEEIVGCNFQNFNEYLLQTYRDNYGKEWDGIEDVHIDHIVPLATAKTEKEVIELCHYTNLQLLKGKDNLSKGDKLDWNLES